MKKAMLCLNFTLDGVPIISLWPQGAVFIELKKRGKKKSRSAIPVVSLIDNGPVQPVVKMVKRATGK